MGTSTITHDQPSPPELRSRASNGEPLRHEVAPTGSAYSAAKSNLMPLRQAIRREQLRLIVPLADTTIYDMERRGEFPRRFQLTPRCVAWDLREVEAWIDARRQASDLAQVKRAPPPDVRKRRHRPVRSPTAS